MDTRALECVLAAFALALAIAALGEEAAAEKPKRASDPAFEPVADDPTLPRVLLIGDSISIGYTAPVRALLKGKANVHRPPTNCGPTTTGLKELDVWLGTGKWHAIHFNWGLHDLKYADEKGRLVPVAQGKQQVPIGEYERNLDELVTRLKKTGARLIWAATTPVPEGAQGRVQGDEVKYNAAAKRVMDKHGVAINDLYTFASDRLDPYAIQLERNVHFMKAGYIELAKQVAASILKALGKRPAEK
ncbi:MAG: SGNH/GDSL hydrolase family protein [Planctomycetes bacterium]|nr:SGNH/GDSL hydrolase family protein [Planctomycetota bacterium]